MSLTGCENFRQLQPPGTIFQQRSRATIHDPFPDNDAGPEIVGGRPPGFDRPLHEQNRNTIYQDTFGNGR